MKLKLVGTLIFLFAYASPFAQESWSGLSANQKIRLAKKEQKAAKKDKEYLQLMEEALSYFQAKEYDKAQEKYKAAHLRRPDNVYPMVMLDDIQVALEKEEETVIVEEIIEEEVIEEELTTPQVEIIEPEVLEEEFVEEQKIEMEEQSEDPITIPKDPEIEITETQKPDLHPERKVVIKQEPKVYLEDGTFFSNFKEGSADIEQIDIVVKGVNTRYRKVSHSWGAIYYFKNEDSITKDEWTKVYKEAKQD